MSEIKVVPCPQVPDEWIAVGEKLAKRGYLTKDSGRDDEIALNVAGAFWDLHLTQANNPEPVEQAAPPRPLDEHRWVNTFIYCTDETCKYPQPHRHGQNIIERRAPAAIEQARPQPPQFIQQGCVPLSDPKLWWWMCKLCGTSTCGEKEPTEHVCSNPNGCNAAAAEPAPERTPPAREWPKSIAEYQEREAQALIDMGLRIIALEDLLKRCEVDIVHDKKLYSTDNPRGGIWKCVPGCRKCEALAALASVKQLAVPEPAQNSKENKMNPELRDLSAKWISYPPVPYTNDPNNLFEIETVSGDGTKHKVTLTRIQAAEVARAIQDRP